MSMSREFAAFVANLRYEDLPPAVVDRAKGVTLEALCSALVAHAMPEDATRSQTGDLGHRFPLAIRAMWRAEAG